MQLAGVAFLKDPADSPFREILWTKTPSVSLLSSVIPKTEQGHGNVSFKCGGFDRSGHLNDCVLSEVEPTKAGYEAAGRKLLAYYTADPGFIRAYASQVDWIIMEMSLSNTAGAPFPGPCWPPFCLAEPPPPPPPPSPSEAPG